MDQQNIFKTITIPKELLDLNLPTPSELNYWQNRNNRTFYIDYDIDENYELVELGKTIIQMNQDEMSISEEDLKPIYIYTFSYGGDLDQSQWFADLLESSRIPIITIAMGACMSGAFIIFLAGKKRYAFKHSQLLIHAGSAGFEGTASQVEEAQKNYKRQLENMKSYVLEHTSIDTKTYNRNKAKDWYLTGEDLLKYHIVDKLIDNISDIWQ